MTSYYDLGRHYDLVSWTSYHYDLVSWDAITTSYHL